MGFADSMGLVINYDPVRPVPVKSDGNGLVLEICNRFIPDILK